MAERFETYICEEGDMIDLIAYKRFGKHGAEVAILDANPGLASQGPILPLGLAIRIPVPEVKDRVDLGNLWESE